MWGVTGLKPTKIWRQGGGNIFQFGRRGVQRNFNLGKGGQLVAILIWGWVQDIILIGRGGERMNLQSFYQQ